MSEHQPPGSSPLKISKTRPPNSPKKKVSFSHSETTDVTASSTSQEIMNTPNARNSTSLDSKKPLTAERQLNGKKEHNHTSPRSRRSSLAAQKEIDSLQPLTPDGQRPVWTPGNAELLSQNLETLLRAARYPPESRSAMVPAAQNIVQISNGSLSKRGKKRLRSDNDFDDKYKDNITPSPNKRPATRSTTSAARKPIMNPIQPLPLNHVVQVEPKIDLTKLAPQPLRISYRSHPLEDRSDAWYTEMFRRLFRQTDKFAIHYFGVHGLEAGDFFEPWAVFDVNDEFVTWAEQVAEPDPHLEVGGWDELLRETDQRKWLVMGILMKILKVKIFDIDLFGASKEQAELLHGLSRAFVGREGKISILLFPEIFRFAYIDERIGFGRQALRAETIRTIIGRNAVTENFYPSIVTLTAQISLLLKPLTDYLYGMQPRLGAPLPKIEDQYQALHNLVSTAAYLSLCIKLSPTIFTFNDVSPGTFYDEKDHYSLDNELYTESREEVLKDYQLRRTIWSDRQAEINAEIDGLEKSGKKNTRTYAKAIAALATHEKIQPTYTDRGYRPMSKIGVWPVITRYKPGGDEDDEKGEYSRYLREKDGFRILQLAKGAVVLYYGWYRKDESGRPAPHPDGEKVRLRCWVRGKTEKKGGLGEKGKMVAGLGAAVVGVMMVGGYGMLSDSFPAIQGMHYVEAARFLACEVFRICQT